MDSSSYIKKVGRVSERLTAINEARKSLSVFDKDEIKHILNQLNGLEKVENDNLLSLTREFKATSQENSECEKCNFKRSCLDNGCYGSTACPGLAIKDY